MVERLGAHIKKELLLLVRDRAGLALLFLMPACLVVIMAVVQDAPFRDFSDRRVKVLFKDLDGGTVGRGILDGLETSASFTVTDASGMADQAFREAVRLGEHQVGIVVPEGATRVLEERSAAATGGLFQRIMADTATRAAPMDSATVQVLVDPALKHAFRQLVYASLQGILAEIGSGRMLVDLRANLEALTGEAVEPLAMAGPFIGVHEETASRELYGDRVAHDSTQHNVPAWTIFAMFFSVVLLGGNMVKERGSGCMARLLTMPGGTGERVTGRIMAYLLVCVSQAALLLVIGVWFLPLVGLPELRVHGAGTLLLLLLASVVVALAATSFGVLVGSVSRSQQQAAVLGSTFVVIMSAIGGIWVPLYVMPPTMRAVGRFSPLHWGMEAFNVPLLREGDLGELWPHLVPLLVFTAVCITVAVTAERAVSSR